MEYKIIAKDFGLDEKENKISNINTDRISVVLNDVFIGYINYINVEINNIRDIKIAFEGLIVDRDLNGIQFDIYWNNNSIKNCRIIEFRELYIYNDRNVITSGNIVGEKLIKK